MIGFEPENIEVPPTEIGEAWAKILRGNVGAGNGAPSVGVSPSVRTLLRAAGAPHRRGSGGVAGVTAIRFGASFVDHGGATMNDQTSAHVYQPGQAELRWMGETSTYFLATGEETGGAFCLVDERAHRGESVPLHRHPEDMESFYVLEGELTLYIDDRPGARAPAGSFAHIPGGTVHGFRIESEQARYLILTTPRHGEFYRAITRASRPGGLPPTERIEGSRIKQASKDYGVEFVGPLPDHES